MKRNINKLLVIITTSVAIAFSTISFFVDLVTPKNIDIEDGLSFGNVDADIEFVLFEDFKCKYCKMYSKEIFPEIKKNYLDTGKIHYTIVPLAFIYGSKLVANAAIAIYELNREQFFEFVKIISQKKAKVETKEQLIEIAKQLDKINIQAFELFLENEAFNNYLKSNLAYAEKLMPAFEVPTAFVNGHKVYIDQIINKIEENLNAIKYSYD